MIQKISLLMIALVLCSCTPKKEIVVNPPYFRNASRGAEYVGKEVCATCHEKRVKDFKLADHFRIEVSGVEGAHGTACEMCHGPGSLHVEGGGDKTKILNLKKDNESCFQCHLEKKAEFKLASHHPVLEGKVKCTDCHDPHGSDTNPWSAVSIRGTNDTCFKCHAGKQGPLTYAHEALSSSCTVCHNPHGSIHPKMLLQNDKNLCLKCHTQTDYPTIGNRGHATYANQGSCWSAGCHTKPHGSNFDPHLRY